MIITRFAPSPTGFLHIGGLRTALFNWLYAKHNNGKFLLRIEDTDVERSSKEAIEAIIDGMKWAGLDWDDKEIYQRSNIARHKEAVDILITNDKAYKCYCTKEELEKEREQAISEKRTYRYSKKCRDIQTGEGEYVVRLKSDLDGKTVINDKVQGEISVENTEIDDLILLRADGTPTYMLAVVVDDHDMGVTDIIRGDDHLTNSFKQKAIYKALGWETPNFAHIPLIHGEDGAKLSKRHGALGVQAYRDMGYMKDALNNYLLRLGWSHGDDEIISLENAIKWFNIENIGKSPSRFDFNKLDNLSSHYIKNSSNSELIEELKNFNRSQNISVESWKMIEAGMEGLKQRATNLKTLLESSQIYIYDVPVEFTDKSIKALDKDILTNFTNIFENITTWDSANIDKAINDYSSQNDIKLGKICGALRTALTGSHISPSVFEILEVLGKDITIKRIKNIFKLF